MNPVITAIREWVEGERVKNGIVLEGARVTNQKWELTYALKREDIDDDASGVVAQALSRIRSGTLKFKRHMDKLVFNVLKNNSDCLDGLALFHATHKVNPADPGSATFANTSRSTSNVLRLRALIPIRRAPAARISSGCGRGGRARP